MSPSTRPLSSSQAAARLGVSAKALRLYEKRGLLLPDRTAAGWRSYGSTQMARAAEIVSLRRLGLALTQIERVLVNAPHTLESILAAHEMRLKDQARQIAQTLGEVRRLKHAPDVAIGLDVGFDLPWPWGGERFEICNIPPLTFIIGPLGSGKTLLAMRLAETLHDARFVGLDRLANDDTAVRLRLNEDAALHSRVAQAMAWLIDAGAQRSAALLSLLVELEADRHSILVIDMIEQDLDQATQRAVAAYIRDHASKRRTLFLMTRSSSILDLDAMGGSDAIILCPANHSPPTRVHPYPGAPGYEAVATCLATPAVRARTVGVIAWLPQRA